MLLVLVIVAVAIAAVVLLIGHFKRGESNVLRQKRPTPLTLVVQIICGNCSGSLDKPIKTHLTNSGVCDQCGSSSYILASTAGMNQAIARNEKLRETHSVASGGKVLSISSSRRKNREQNKWLEK